MGGVQAPPPNWACGTLFLHTPALVDLSGLAARPGVGDSLWEVTGELRQQLGIPGGVLCSQAQAEPTVLWDHFWQGYTGLFASLIPSSFTQ